jgi:hypothetical protein
VRSGLWVCQEAKSLKELALQGKVIKGVVGNGKVAECDEEVFDGLGIFGGKAFILAVEFIGAGEGFYLEGGAIFEFGEGEVGFFGDEAEVFPEVALSVFHPGEEAPSLGHV